MREDMGGFGKRASRLPVVGLFSTLVGVALVAGAMGTPTMVSASVGNSHTTSTSTTIVSITAVTCSQHGTTCGRLTVNDPVAGETFTLGLYAKNPAQQFEGPHGTATITVTTSSGGDESFAFCISTAEVGAFKILRVQVASSTAPAGQTIVGTTTKSDSFQCSELPCPPSPSPSGTPSGSPSGSPSASPSGDPTASPSGDPTASPSGDPTASPSGDPTASPSGDPTASPSGDPTASPSGDPTASPSGDPTAQPSGDPTDAPSPSPSESPSASPSPTGTVQATGTPSTGPTNSPGGVLGTSTTTPDTGAGAPLGLGVFLILAGMFGVVRGRSRSDDI